MPFVNGQYQADSRSPIERLAGFEQKQAEIQKLRQAQAMARQRQQIMAESFRPEQDVPGEVQTPEQVDAALSRMFPVGGAPAMQPSELPATTRRQPASFDKEAAMARLYGIGDMEGASALVNDEYKANMSAGRGVTNSAYGSEYVQSDRPGFMHPAQYMRGGGLSVDRTSYIPEKLTYRDLGGEDVAVGATGEVRAVRPKTATVAQRWQMDDSAQAEQARRVEQAKIEGRGVGEKATTDVEKNADINGQIAMIQMLREKAANDFRGSTLTDRAAQVGTDLTGIGSGNAAYSNTKEMQLIAKKLLLASKPKGSGNPTEGEWKMYGQTIADPSQYPDSKTYQQALDNYEAVLTGQRPMPEQYREKPATATATASRPMPPKGSAKPAMYKQYEQAIKAAGSDRRKIDAINARAKQAGII